MCSLYEGAVSRENEWIAVDFNESFATSSKKGSKNWFIGMRIDIKNTKEVRFMETKSILDQHINGLIKKNIVLFKKRVDHRKFTSSTTSLKWTYKTEC